MKNSKPLICSLVCLIFVFSVTAQDRASITWEVLKYDIIASLPQNYATDRNLDVVATMNLKNASDQTFSRLTLRISDQAEISSITANGSAADFRKSEESIGDGLKLQRAIVSLPTISPNSTFSVKVSYKLRVKANSALNSLSPVETQFLPMSFWYPAPNSWFFAGGADFAPYSLRINNAAGLTIVSSGESTAGGFEQKLNGQPFFTSGKWEIVEASGIKVYAPSGGDTRTKSRANELALFLKEANEFVATFSGKSITAPMRIVAVNRGAGFSDSGTVFVDDSVFRRQKLDSQTAMILAEAAAKFWLGNAVEVNGVGYGVIREGLSKYLATRLIENKFGKDVADIERLKQRTNYSAIANRDAPLIVASPIDGFYYTATANKGAMIWKFLALNSKDQFFKTIQGLAGDGNLSLDELRAAFSAEKDYLDFMIDNATSMNLMIGLPQQQGGQTKVAVRNISEVPTNVDVVGLTSSGKRITSNVSIPSNGFSEAVFQSAEKIVRAEIDPDKIYPQTDYVDDVAPRAISENDPLLFIKKDFDRQRFADAEKKALTVLSIYPQFDDAKIMLGRSLLAQQKITEAERIFQSVLDEKLPSAQSLARANLGLGELALKTGQSAKAIQFFNEAIRTDGEYGATLAARTEREKIGGSSGIDPALSAFFSSFDLAVSANDKSRIDSMTVPGEVSKFASGVAGQAQEWVTTVLKVDPLDDGTFLVETRLTVKLLSRNQESGKAVFRMSKVGGQWKMSNVEIFEVG